MKTSDTTKSDTTRRPIGCVCCRQRPKRCRFWKIGHETILSKTVAGITFKSAEAHAIAISNNDIYVVGYGIDMNGATSALIWKNGKTDTLARPAKSSTGVVINRRALSIAVFGSDIYIGGDDYTGIAATFPTGGAVLWKNGVPTSYGDYPNSFSTIVVVNGMFMPVSANRQHLICRQFILRTAYRLFVNRLLYLIGYTILPLQTQMCMRQVRVPGSALLEEQRNEIPAWRFWSWRDGW